MPLFGRDKTTMISPEDALPGRDQALAVSDTHVVLGTPMEGPWPDGHEVLYVAMGCFWGAERFYWQIEGVHSTAVGYMGGWTRNPTYEETCTAMTGHTETVQVVYDPAAVDIDVLLQAFWENHDPTTPNRQGGDVGTQYRSAIYWTTPEQEQTARELTKVYGEELARRGLGEITTEIRPSSETPYFYAEDAHQQYLAKNPFGYRCHANTGVKFPETA